MTVKNRLWLGLALVADYRCYSDDDYVVDGDDNDDLTHLPKVFCWQMYLMMLMKPAQMLFS